MPDAITQNPDLQAAGVAGPESDPQSILRALSMGQQPNAMAPQAMPAMPQQQQGPMNTWASTLAGFGAGFQGKENPVIAQQMQQQDVDRRSQMAIFSVMQGLQKSREQKEGVQRLILQTLAGSANPETRTFGLRGLMGMLERDGIKLPPDISQGLLYGNVTSKDMDDIAQLVAGGADLELIKRSKPDISPQTITGILALKDKPGFHRAFNLKTPEELELERQKNILTVEKLRKEVEKEDLAKPPSAHIHLDTLIQERQALITKAMQDPALAAENAPAIRALTERIDTLKPYVVPEGGTLFGLGSRAPLITGQPKPPEAGERKAISEANSILTLGDNLITRWTKEPKLMPGVVGRLKERELPLGLRLSQFFGPGMNEEQRRFMADAAIVIGSYRRAYSGLAVTAPESLMSAPVVPQDAGAMTMAQLKAIVSWTRENRKAMDEVLIEAGRRPGAPAPQMPQAGPGPMTRRVRVRSKTDAKREGWVTLSSGELLPPGVEEIK